MKIDRNTFKSLALSMMGASSLAACVVKQADPATGTTTTTGPGPGNEVQPTDERAMAPTDESGAMATSECVAWNEYTGECAQECVAWDEMGCVSWAPVGYYCLGWDEMTGNCSSFAPMDEGGYYGEPQCVAWDEYTGECTYWGE